MTADPRPAQRRRSPLRPVDLPDEVRAVLRTIAADMRDVPRGCLHDPGELFVWLRRMAARVEGVERVRIEPLPVRSGSTRRPQNSPVGGFSGVARYPGSGLGAKPPPTARKWGLRTTIIGPTGRLIPVETRQLTFWS